MGRHVAEGRKRGIAGWPLLVLGVIVVLVAGTIGYFAVLRKDRSTDSGACTGSVTLPLLASSGASPAARALSDAFNATSPSARSTCLTTSVTSLPSPAAAAALIAHWKGRSDPAPGVWLTDDGSALLEVDKKASDLTAGRDADPLATSPVVLAMRADDAAKAGRLQWADLPRQLGSGGTVRGADGKPVPLLFSDPQGNRASGYAAESVLAGDGKALTVAQAESRVAELKPLMADPWPPTTGDALDQLAGGTAPGAVPVTEADLAAFNAGSAGNGPALTAVQPSGPTAGDQVFAVALSGDWVTPTLRDAASRFAAFTRSPQGSSVLAAAHFRVQSSATTSGGPAPTLPVTPLPPAAAGVAAALATGLGADPAGTSDPEPTDPSDGGTPTTAVTTTQSPVSTTSTGRGVVNPPATSASRPTAGNSTGSAPAGTSTTTSRSTARSTKTPPASSTSRPSTSRTTTPPAAKPGPNVTLLVDTTASWAAVIDGKSRTQWLQEGLGAAVDQAGNNGVGLWAASSTIGDAGYSQLVPVGPLTAALEGGTRASALQTAIGGLGNTGSKRYYAATPAAMAEAAKTATAAQPGRVVLVTDGADQTPSTPRADVVNAIAAIAAANPSLRLDVIGVGNAAPADALGALAAAGNGTYTHVDTKDLPAALVTAVKG